MSSKEKRLRDSLRGHVQTSPAREWKRAGCLYHGQALQRAENRADRQNTRRALAAGAEEE